MTTPAGVDWSKVPSPYDLDAPSVFVLAWRNYRLAWCVAAAAIAAAVYFGYVRGEWRPTGDGQTVVHSRTGELRPIRDVTASPRP
jgi:hypothetical protein